MEQQPRFTTTLDAAGATLTNIDSTTGLEWLITPLPRAPHQKQLDAIAALDTAGHTDWRLPTRAELLSLVDLTKYGPCIDTDAFPDFPASWFWTSTLCAWSSSSAWGVYFYYGFVDYSHRDYDGFALAVRRSGQSFASVRSSEAHG